MEGRLPSSRRGSTQSTRGSTELHPARRRSSGPLSSGPPRRRTTRATGVTIATQSVAPPREEDDAADEDLIAIFDEMAAEEPGLAEEAFEAHREMAETPVDALDFSAAQKPVDEGVVARRTPVNALNVFGKKDKAIADPALRDNPLRGRLIMTLNSSTVLFMIFTQSLVVNYLQTGKWVTSQSANPMYGPEPDVLNDLGGLNTNEIRAGQTIRIFWAMWMHSGWIHIAINVLSQMQFLYMFEPDWGFWRCALLFWFAGVSGNIMSATLDPCSVTVGSSGALYGLMGAMLVYCMEYWDTIPMPWCILLFTFIVVIVSLITGFTGTTDNWAHMGGLLGGLFFTLGTVTSLTPVVDCLGGCCPKLRKSKTAVSTPGGRRASGSVVDESGKRRKREIKRAKLAHFSMRQGTRECSCAPREWAVRCISWALMFVMWFLSFWYIYEGYDFQPPGHVTFQGRSACCCCYKTDEPDEFIRKNFECYHCYLSFGTMTWGEFCEHQRNGNLNPFGVPRLLEESYNNSTAIADGYSPLPTIGGSTGSINRYDRGLNLLFDGERMRRLTEVLDFRREHGPPSARVLV